MTCPCTVVAAPDFPDSVVHGDTARWVFCIKNDDGSVADATGWLLILIIRDSLDAESSTFSRTIENRILADPDGEPVAFATITLHSTDSAEIPPGKYYYELKRVIDNITPPDVWTISTSQKPDFVVLNGTALYTN